MWIGTRSIRFVQYTLTKWWCLRFRRTVGSSSKMDSYRNDPGRSVQVKISGFCSASNCIRIVWPRDYSKQWATELFRVEDIRKTSYWSDDDNQKLQSLERKSGERSSNQESERKESQRWEEKWENAISGKQMDKVQKETHVVSVMTQHLETGGTK